MKKIHPNTTIALVLLLASIGSMFTSIPYASSILAIGAIAMALSETAKFTSWYQFLILFLSSGALGASLDPLFTGEFLPSGNNIPFIRGSMVFAVSVNYIRLIFFTTFGYSRFRYFEAFMMLLAIGFYLAGNVLYPGGWERWVFPIPVLIFCGYIANGVIQDSKGLLAYLKKRKYVEIGAPAPEFALPDQDGNTTRLSDFKGQRDLLLIFVRGDWCPGCHMMLRTYQRESHRFKEKNILCMAIGPDPVGVNRQMVEKLGLDFKVLSDDGQRTAQTYGCRLDDDENLHPVKESHKYEEGIPLPASFLVDKQGIVRYASRPDRVGEFLDPSKIFPILEKLGG